ncbi:hypothetical protein JKF63_05319 [Porcisia hertigi]|uniref:Uncharacterized protein n=1 Tax=Porcisia hertigi TaxID=2761500 RepID=A0A836IMD4_9TRYP|nr:hypothetical protein JKF63_05319 [Porcisia hertigi]
MGTGEAASAVPAPPASSVQETSATAGSQVEAPTTNAAAATGDTPGTEAKWKHLRALRLMSPVAVACTPNGITARKTDSSGAIARAPAGKGGVPRRAPVWRRSAPGAQTRGRRDNFRCLDGVSYKNFFYEHEYISTFGVGTVGLFADKETLHLRASCPATRELSSAPHHRSVRNEDGRQRPAEQLAATVPSPSEGTQTKLAARSNYTSASYTTPAMDNAIIWGRREESYQNWRRENLTGSTYYRLSRLPDVREGPGARANGGDLSPCRADNTAALHTDEERERIARLRLRAIQAERKARSNAREQERATYEEEVLLLRMRKLCGEGVDLPDSYLRATYPDPSTLTGYAEAVSQNGKGRPYRSPHRSEAASGYLKNPRRIVRDHALAVQQHRQSAREVQLVREAQHLEESEHQRRQYTAELSDSQSQQREYLACWMDGRSRLSRAREAERHARHDAETRSAAQCNRTLRTRDRELYALYAAQEAAADAARQQDLRVRVVGRPLSLEGSPGGQRFAPKTQPLLAAAAQHDADDTPRDSKRSSPGAAASARFDNSSPHSVIPMLPVVPRQTAAVCPTAAAARPITPVPPPSHEAGPTSRNFFNEVKEWAQSFPSPNTIPANGADAAFRRLWRAELVEARLHSNREAVQRQREAVLRRVQEAREKTFEENWKHAEKERHEKRELAMRRADNTLADIEAATDLRLGLLEEAHRMQQSRMVQAAERHDETQLQRQQSKKREEVLRSLEAEGLNQLRIMVSSASGTHRS